MCSGDENLQISSYKKVLREWLKKVSEMDVRALAKVRPEHLEWFLGLTKEEREKLVRKTSNGPHGGKQEIF